MILPSSRSLLPIYFLLLHWGISTLFHRSKPYPPPTPSTSCILITGTSSGIGHHAALHLTKLGYHVFAGVRKIEDAKKLSSDYEEILRLRGEEVVRGGGCLCRLHLCKPPRHLTTLINNAGIQQITPLEQTSLSSLQKTFSINTFSPIILVQKFLPLLRKSPTKRIVNIGSISSYITPPFYGIYGASKSAFESVNDALRVELREWNISVSLLLPGSIDTPIEKKMVGQAKLVIENDKEEQLYAARMFRMSHALDYISDYPPLKALAFSDVEETTKAIVDAVESGRPKTKYMVGMDAWFYGYLVFVPDRIVDWFMSFL
ncbi:hypothetical protein TL16_g01321 [Triparma laevis f. inornata]|uniref:NAD(P)-binding protein n=1 Tax=Triparma laevis f. inornata TaxID=1714386 RepID=A0A9W6ZMW0_9STRA|nr:hypothetical protein TL16_g01321 [Triparma laevis f. inornata]